MDAEIEYLRLKSITLMEFPDVVISASVPRGHLNVAKSLRLFLTDNSFVEIWISNEKYSLMSKKAKLAAIMKLQ